MIITLLLLSGILCFFISMLWKNLFAAKRNTGKMSSNLTAFARTSCSCHSCTQSPSVTKLAQDIINSFPTSMSLHKRILVNFKVMQHQLIELEQLLTMKDLNIARVTKKSTRKVQMYHECKGIH
ncbi:PREDICTED: kita-kyushu lung cancer antigen 1 homolog [Chinchilla lanigera]|uniref:kita-kyushu lung cancer antigen 1 homolog n=1 Tax=Chinchilla lanigera TaxID=34839 RepID=UPI00038F02E6|nr:PREDICTED: kita-kyushu lung cancer antigen 1 homolog [Chinchilla lanigera]